MRENSMQQRFFVIVYVIGFTVSTKKPLGFAILVMVGFEKCDEEIKQVNEKI
jgi:hypothetical protein